MSCYKWTKRKVAPLVDNNPCLLSFFLFLFLFFLFFFSISFLKRNETKPSKWNKTLGDFPYFLQFLAVSQFEKERKKERKERKEGKKERKKKIFFDQTKTNKKSQVFFFCKFPIS